jgi:hypothetical protein
MLPAAAAGNAMVEELQLYTWQQLRQQLVVGGFAVRRGSSCRVPGCRATLWQSNALRQHYDSNLQAEDGRQTTIIVLPQSK